MQDGIIDSYDPREWARHLANNRAQTDSGLRRASPLPALGLAGAILCIGAVVAVATRGPAPGNPAESPLTAVRAENAGPKELRRTLVLPQSADLPQMLAAQGIDGELARQITANALKSLSPTGEIRAVLVLDAGAQKPQFLRLEASNLDSSGVIVRRDAAGAVTATQVAAQVETRMFVRHGTMDGDSFYSSAVAVGIPNNLIPVFAKALSFDFDFQRDVSAGDAFEAAYFQNVNAAGEAIGAPTLLFASLTTATKSASVYRFAPAGGSEEWFDASGRSTVRSLMRTPVDGARITSKFGMRFHPVLKYLRLHGGIDFAAPIGTPIYAAADGVVTVASPSGCAGNMVMVDHAKGLQTRYFHASRYAEGLHVGQQVRQGETISYVGTTGTCTTGPHLHYETWVNGEHVDPLSIQSESSGRTLSGQELLQFEALRDRVDVGRAQQSG